MTAALMINSGEYIRIRIKTRMMYLLSVYMMSVSGPLSPFTVSTFGR